ncbi:branched-chain amino acid ABC transporter permease [Candidatus Bathyarchaeota archaeon]|nr:branched-chain amino acid ABC transporter permease [Candidatus Bathyarchaeota archaeon]MBS7629558.1 branched-chain amino acid ABC transporter permease [Candidatus Bathyarchaeota archaeon]
MWGVAIGCIYILMATGLNLIFGVMKIVNFAHGQLLMLGAYMCYWSWFILGVNPYFAILLSMIIVSIVGAAVERLCFSPIIGTSKLNEIFVSLGLIYIFDYTAVMLWTDKPRSIVTPFEYSTFSLGVVAISYDWLIAIMVVSMILVGMFLILAKTKIGRAMRATSQNMEAAMMMGINVKKVYTASFSLGSALAAAAGSLFGIIFSLDPYMGSLPAIKAFAIIILGGLGSIRGAVIGGLLYGIAENMATLFLGGIWRHAVAFAVLIIVLTVKPTGLFGEGR